MLKLASTVAFSTGVSAKLRPDHWNALALVIDSCPGPCPTARSVKNATEQSGPRRFAGSSLDRPVSWKSNDPCEAGPMAGPGSVCPLGPRSSKTPWLVPGIQSRQLPLPPWCAPGAFESGGQTVTGYADGLNEAVPQPPPG